MPEKIQLSSSGEIRRKSTYTLWISSCIVTARERIPGSMENYATGVSAAISNGCTSNY
ncbi:hypothetical protein [Photorhabdus laumondii]|uniref:hypothetical protein n=1 Tax=Photorhabdus laumondii TaxID=2218628 RepID=UPI0033160957